MSCFVGNVINVFYKKIEKNYKDFMVVKLSYIDEVVY